MKKNVIVWYANSMSLRALFALVFAVITATGYGSVWFYGDFVLPRGSGYSYMVQPAFILVSILLAVIGILLFVVVRLIEQPLRKLTASIEFFSENSGNIIIPVSWITPLEIRKLVKSFTTFSASVLESQKRSAENARVKTDFISTAAHQLRTPLTGIRWALEALLNDNPTPEQKELISAATEKSHDLVDTVGTLLDISSIESGKYRYTFVKLDMQKFIIKEVEDFKHFAEERNVNLQLVLKDKQLPPARADRERIKWVLDNLIENAIRYTPKGGSVSVYVKAIGNEKIVVHVKDTGIGIPASDRANIFERFHRSSNAIAKENKGNGLGLYIARTIATDHGGDLNFSENTNGIGTVFTLSLPVAT